MSLYCAGCNAPHDVDLAPDTGECVLCGARLIEDEQERAEVTSGRGFTQAMVEAANDGLLRVAVARGKAAKGQN